MLRCLAFLLFLCPISISAVHGQPKARHNLTFDRLPVVWDEALPLGNGTVGALIWEKDHRLRFSLDRADIWDMRPMKGLHRKEFSFDWVRGQVLKNDYKPVQEYFDAPYDREPAPSKIPAGALEFELPGNIRAVSASVSLENATCEVHWNNGLKLTTFVHATQPVGWFRFENAAEEIKPVLAPPPYQARIGNSVTPNSLIGDDLARLGYKPGVVKKTSNEITYEQEGWGGLIYRISVRWKKVNATTTEGAWSVSAHYPGKNASGASKILAAAFPAGMKTAFASHAAWWNDFWQKSAVSVPDSLLEKQWYLEQYKFGSVAREDTPPISLQGVWTADNGRIPPWKGDFHHDLNTQLSYWPAYSGNHLKEALGYLNHLDANKANYKRYTRQYFGVEGLNVPGVTTLDGTEMGGWIQYSLSPTVSAWLAHHYYLQWRYSMDREFLKSRAYPWFREVATFLAGITRKDENGLRQLPLSSSPEINNNSINAWFTKNTNYDLALMKFVFKTAAELARELALEKDAARWLALYSEFGAFATTGNDELMFAENLPYHESHRHFSHLMAIHPLGLIKWEDGEAARSVIKNTIRSLETVGPALWCGYSYSWSANLYARAKDGESAAKALRIFAKAFCLPNSFHANGDQTRSGYSTFTYRPFTLEGNMAFAAGLQEMLLQSYNGAIEIMPAVPSEWQNISFRRLRAEGAFLVDASMRNGRLETVTIQSEKGGKTKLMLPLREWNITAGSSFRVADAGDGYTALDAEPGAKLVLTRK
ncbi:hypothetical protein GCM10023091_11930 [Ravibacter arvi]|uniref:Glycosyl hydrolase family 95 N-terminal domain-containing protein n=1 Tax=Ravibacter arvi TaxID=2051041 RepID=A0ABP8LUW0_9BACT